MEKQVLRTLNVFYYGAMVVAVLMAVLGWWLTSRKGIYIDPLTQPGVAISYVVILYIIVSIPVSLWWHNRKTKALRGQSDPTEKLSRYRKYSIIRIAATGIGLAVSVFFFYILHQNSMIFCAGIAAIGLYFCKPTEAKLLTDLDDTLTE